MLLYYLLIFCLIPITFVVQQFIPTFEHFYQSQILLLPLFFICCVVTVRFPTMLALAFISGFLWDIHHTLTPLTGDAVVYTNPIEMFRFGYSVLLYALIGMLAQTLAPFLRDKNWAFIIPITALVLSFYLVTEYLLLAFIRGDIGLNYNGVLLQILLTTLFTMVLAPVIYLSLSAIAKSCRYRTFDSFR